LSPLRLVLASNNHKKRHEIATVLASCGVVVVPVTETVTVQVVEDGDSFKANAAKKARAFAAANNLPALADDSGLCVHALNGAPGIYSSRYAGTDGDDAANNRKLLREMAAIENRNAYFACHLYLAFPDNSSPPLQAEGRVHGTILTSSDGEQGFGYDPLFFSPELGVSFAHASVTQKASVSHRGRALRALAEQLQSHLV